MVVLTPELHYFRNKLNIEYEWNDFEKLNERLPEKYRWERMGTFDSSFHQNTATLGKPNRKYVSFDGYFEAVYSYDNVLLNEETASIDMGTYNYSPSTAWKRNKNENIKNAELKAKLKHTEEDVVTYFAKQNTKKDSDELKRKHDENNKYRY